MAWTEPKTWEVLEQLTAAKMNEQVRDNFNYLKSEMKSLQSNVLYPVGSNEATDATSTTSTSYVDLDSMSVSLTLPEGTYRIFVSWYTKNQTWSGNDRSVWWAVFEDSTQKSGDYYLSTGTNGTINYKDNTCVFTTSGGATKTYKIRIKVNSGTNLSTTDRAMVVAAEAV